LAAKDAQTQRKRIEAEKAALEIRKAISAKNLLAIAAEAPEVLKDATAAYQEMLAEEKTLNAQLAQSITQEEEKKAYLERCRELWDALLKGQLIDIVSRICVRFAEQTRTTRTGRQRIRQVPVDCLIEFKSLVETEQGPIMPFRFESIGGTLVQGKVSPKQTEYGPRHARTLVC
jgi:hypothetical protein